MSDKDKDLTFIQCGPTRTATKIEGGKVLGLQVAFPLPVKLPPGFDLVLESLVNMVCETYEQANPYRSMWPSGHGGIPDERAIYTDDHENMFDMSVFHIQVSEKPADARTLQRRGYTLCDTLCPECSAQQFKPKVNECSESGYVTCPDKHLRESGEGQGTPIVKIHILCVGKPICGFSQALPAQWPPHNKWISFEDAQAKNECNCDLCKRVFRSMKNGQ